MSVVRSSFSREENGGTQENEDWKASELELDGLSKPKVSTVSPESIYTTANISAFASVCSLVALVVGIITVMLTSERSLLTTMKMSYEFMKQISDGWHKGIQQIQLNTEAEGRLDFERQHEVDMSEQLSQLVQTMYSIPWRQLRENVDEQQLTELFKLIPKLPSKIDEIHDMVWSICVELRRLLGITTDYCIPSTLHTPSKIIITHALSVLLNGEYLEKGLNGISQHYYTYLHDANVYLSASQLSSDYDSFGQHTYQDLSTQFVFEPRVFEKLMILSDVDEDFLSFAMTTDMMLINRRVVHEDANWHMDQIQIKHIHTFKLNANERIYNPWHLSTSTLSLAIDIVVTQIKVRNPAKDLYHIYKLHEDDDDGGSASTSSRLRYKYDSSSSFTSTESGANHQIEAAKTNMIVLDTRENEWQFKKQHQNEDECMFKASSLNVEIHKAMSWQFCEHFHPQKGQLPPTLFLHELFISVRNRPDLSGYYKATKNPFQAKYFTPNDANPNYIFIKQSEHSESGQIITYRLFMGNAPDHTQWYLDRFNSTPMAKSVCRSSINVQQEQPDSESEHRSTLCARSVPNHHWVTAAVNQADGAHSMSAMRVANVQFMYDKHEINSILLLYQNFIGEENRLSDENLISLIPKLLIKGSDLYTNIFARKEETKNVKQHYDQIVVDLKTVDAEQQLSDFCVCNEQTSPHLPTVQLNNYEGKVEAIGGRIRARLIISFYSTNDCQNAFYTMSLMARPFSFID